MIRAMEEFDFDSIMVIQSQCYTEIEPESRLALISKLRISPKTCWVAEIDGHVQSYLICHPWIMGSIPTLDAPLSVVPKEKDLFYIHDLAVRVRGLGLGKALVETALVCARSEHYKAAGLIAVQGSSEFWRKFGFVPSDSLDSEGLNKLQSYGSEAIYMQLNVYE